MRTMRWLTDCSSPHDSSVYSAWASRRQRQEASSSRHTLWLGCWEPEVSECQTMDSINAWQVNIIHNVRMGVIHRSTRWKMYLLDFQEHHPLFGEIFRKHLKAEEQVIRWDCVQGVRRCEDPVESVFHYLREERGICLITCIKNFKNNQLQLCMDSD